MEAFSYRNTCPSKISEKNLVSDYYGKAYFSSIYTLGIDFFTYHIKILANASFRLADFLTNEVVKAIMKSDEERRSQIDR
jgi:hypothetical protein